MASAYLLNLSSSPPLLFPALLCPIMRFRHLLLLLLHLLTTYPAALIAEAALCLPEESHALLQLNSGFNSTSKIKSWQQGSDCCLWDGISCDNSTGHVIALDLNGRHISGKLDHSLFNLTHLTKLNLAYNLFGGIRFLDLPFSRLPNLTSLNLSNAGFAGQISADIGRLEKLVSLDLSNFYLGQLPSSSPTLHEPRLGSLIRNLSNLKQLVLDGVNISADGVEWCRAVAESAPGLQMLSLVGCSLTGPIHSSFSRLGSLSTLRLDQNNLNSSVPGFLGNISSLSVLRLSSCRLQGSFPERIFRLANLTVLDISENRMLSGRLPQFDVGSALESLVLYNTNFSWQIPVSIGNLKALSRLQLSNCSFSGLIPPSIGNLSQMVRFDLSLNNFSGEIPPLGQWLKITEINLACNSLTGSISYALGKQRFPNLTKIDLRNNSLSGSIPVSLFGLPSLQVLQLNQNLFTGPLEQSFSASPSLATVDLSNNRLQGSLPVSMFNLSGLKVLSLASNNLSGTLEIDQFWKLRNLSNLDLSNNMLRIREGDNSRSFPNISTLKLVSCNLKRIPAFLQYQDRVSSLDLSANSIPGVIPSWIWGIGNETLSYLNLSSNLFTAVEEPPNLIARSSIILDLHRNRLQGSIPLPPPNTIFLDYSSNKFTTSIPPNFTAYLSYTLFLSLSNNSLVGEIPSSICTANYLQVLDLSENNLSGSIPPCLLDGSTDLRVIDLRGNQLRGQFPQNISEGCALRTLDFNRNQLKGKLPRSLSKCYSLEVLDVGNNYIHDTFPNWLGNISELRVLVLKSNAFYGNLVQPPGICNNNTFSKLQILDLSSNNFTGNLPQTCFECLKAMTFSSDGGRQIVGYRYLQYSRSSYYQNTVTITSKGQTMTLSKVLTIYTAIDLSNNKLNGSIPEVIGELNSLCVLNISYNSLTGGIPLGLGNMSQLESLDLSNNHLSGKIPQDLASLNFLSFLNLSNNNLTGQIPHGRQLQTFTDSSFEGNEGLCGYPLKKTCDKRKELPSTSNMSSSGSSIDVNWQCVFIGLGFGAGMAVVVGPVMVWSKGKRWYNKHIDNFFLAVIPSCIYETCGDVKVAAEDICSGSVEVEKEGQRYCLFCTVLECRAGKAIVHHMECSCY